MEKVKYSFVEREGQDNWVVEIKEGAYEGTFLTFGKVNVRPPEGYTWEDLEEPKLEIDPVLSYNYGIIESASDPEELVADPEFNNYVGDLLVNIIQDSFDSGDYIIGDKNASEPRNDNPAESDQQ